MRASIQLLESLRQHGFRGHRLCDRRGRVTTLEYRRTWRGVVDVVLVFGEDDAEAYRGDDRIADEDPFALAWQPQLERTAFGTVAEVVPIVLSWPAPGAWTPAPPAPLVGNGGHDRQTSMTPPPRRPGAGRPRNGEQA